jgi:hypothetical protein
LNPIVSEWQRFIRARPEGAHHFSRIADHVIRHRNLHQQVLDGNDFLAR